MKQFCWLLSLLLISTTIQAQGELSGGFKAGLNFSNLDGPVESEGETFDINTGFHIGATFIYSITDLFGLKGELMYSQKGTQYGYEGPSYFNFYTPQGGIIASTGTKKIDLSVSNTYLDIPLMVYYKIGIIELEAGVNAAILIGSRGNGGVTYSGLTGIGDPVTEFTLNAEHRYFSDDPGISSRISAETLNLNGLQVLRPTSLGAYYHSPENDTKKYKRFDYGLNAGVSIFVNGGMYIGLRANLGMADVTNEEQDIAVTKTNLDNSFITRNDEDKNLSFQASVGFRF